MGSQRRLKTVLHQAIFLATCRNFVVKHVSRNVVKCNMPEMNISPNFFTSIVERSSNVTVIAETLRDMFISGHITLCCASCNLYHNGATKLRGKSRVKLPSVHCSNELKLYFCTRKRSCYANET